MSCRIGPTARRMTSASRPVGIRHFLVHDLHLAVGGIPDAAQERQDPAVQPFPNRRVGRDAAIRRMGLHRFLEGVLPRLDVQVLLAAEMVVHGGRIGPGLLANLGVGGLPEPLLGKHLRRGVQQPLPRLLRVFSRLFVSSGAPFLHPYTDYN